MSDVKLGLGNVTGMFYHAPAGTELPTDPTAELGSAWTHIGDVSDAGITLSINKSTTNLRNWANAVKRVIMTEHSETIQCAVMDTTEESLKTVFGASNVTVANRVITVNLSDGNLPPEEAFLWVMKDGDDMIMIGCSRGQVSAVDNVTFAPGDVISWKPTITAMGDGFHLIANAAA
ncbi:MAG: hypothetical protein J6E40_06585 [Lachnospiraceae bacterium]|nr:hypothetical protein [Lachnospiraceae bacterium]